MEEEWEVMSLRELVLDRCFSQIKKATFLREYFCKEAIFPLSKADIFILCSFWNFSAF